LERCFIRYLFRLRRTIIKKILFEHEKDLGDKSYSKRLSLKIIVDLDTGSSSKRLLLKFIDDLIFLASSKRFF
jgi:hypothetical protein